MAELADTHTHFLLSPETELGCVSQPPLQRLRSCERKGLARGAGLPHVLPDRPLQLGGRQRATRGEDCGFLD